MENSSNALLNDVNVPNHIDDYLNELLNSTWDHKAMDQPEYDAFLLTPIASPTYDKAESKASEKYANQKKLVFDRGMLTPETSPSLCNERSSDFPTQQERNTSQTMNAQPEPDVTLKPVPSGVSHSVVRPVTESKDNANSKPMIPVRKRIKQTAFESSENTGGPCFPVQQTEPKYAVNDDTCSTCVQLSTYSTNVRQPAISETKHSSRYMGIASYTTVSMPSQYQASGRSTYAATLLNTVPVCYQPSQEVFMTQSSFSPMPYIPYYTHHNGSPPTRECWQQAMVAATNNPSNSVQSNEVIYADQPVIPMISLPEVKLETTSASSVDVNVASASEDCSCELQDSMQPTPRMSCAEYLSSVKMSPDLSESTESPPAYYILIQDPHISTSSEQSPPFQILLESNQQQQIVVPEVTSIAIPQIVPIPAISSDREPDIEPMNHSGDYVQIQNNYVLPSEGSTIAFPVEEIYRVDRQETPAQGPIKKKPRKANINYGTDFYCRLCRKEFGKRGSFQQHWRQKHEDPRPFRCDTCGKTYLTERDLQQHKENHDPDKKQWKCTECDNRYRHMKDRDRHYDSHHGTPGHPCVVEGCEKAFARRDHMLAHVVTHTNRTMREIKKAQEKEEKQLSKVKRGRKRKME